jgi:hypothetical protein
VGLEESIGRRVDHRLRARIVLAHPGSCSARSAKNRSSFAVVLAMRSLALAMASDIVKAPFIAGL